jgi:four helix bundle protein
MAVHRFEELEVFKRAYKVSLKIPQISLTMPQVEQYGLAEQMRRASKSICANLAEGFGKQSLSKTEFKRFVKMGIGSADEMRVWLRYCLDLGYIDQIAWQRLRNEYEEVLPRCCKASRTVGFDLIPDP